jgi:hypothetical protein
VRTTHEQLEKLAKTATGPTKEAVEALDKKVNALLESPAPSSSPAATAHKPPTPGTTTAPPAPSEATLTQVSGNIAALYAEIDRADVAPTPAQSQALTTIERDYAACMKRWEALHATDIPALNRHLKSANLPELTLNSNMQVEEEEGSDEE